VKLTIQHASNVGEGQLPERRTLGELEFTRREGHPPEVVAVPDTPIPVDEDGALVIHCAYVPFNRGLSVMVSYHTAAGMTHVFTGMATWGPPPPYFAFILPTGQFIELYFQPD
jgi:hypothetical protein